MFKTYFSGHNTIWATKYLGGTAPECSTVAMLLHVTRITKVKMEVRITMFRASRYSSREDHSCECRIVMNSKGLYIVLPRFSQKCLQFSELKLRTQQKKHEFCFFLKPLKFSGCFNV